ncbi:sensor histidine kinase [Blastococcus sp. URHD0036]|uniref:sensor histidine kinase n=1 Tax=Blastococcus sp. URHD0036 TaxID=1380356 RepID=UPI0012DC6049|nr:sensor histidine kinase [Blastococcus sp. URHD0036]
MSTSTAGHRAAPPGPAAAGASAPPTRHPGPGEWLRSLAVPATVVVLALAAGGLALALAAGLSAADCLHLLPVTACAVTGGLVARRRPDNPIGFLLLGSAACFALLDACGFAALRAPAGSSAAAVLGWPQTWLWVPANALLSVTPVFFPDGRPATGWRHPLRGLAALTLGATVLSALRPGTDVQLGVEGRPNALGVPGLAPVADAVGAASVLVGGLVLVVGGVDLLRRVGREPSGSRLRQQAEWLAYAVGLAVLLVLTRLLGGLTDGDPDAVFPSGIGWELTGAAAASLLPVGLGVAVVRHRLLDIDRLISRTVVLVALSAAVATLYLGGVAAAGALVGDGVRLPASLGAAVVAAVLLAPLGTGLQRRVDRLLYGERGNPHAVLARLGRGLESAPHAVSLASAAETVRVALQLPGVAIDVTGGERVVDGRVPGHPVALPLLSGGEDVGRLLLAPRAGEATLGRRDLRVLRDLAPGIAGAVRAARESDRAARLAADLQRSRERLVLAREEERRRLRRDFHDGLGPVLAGLAMRAETAREVTDPDVARQLLDEVAEDARTALADVRRLVDGLRPPALDHLGLAAALDAALTGRPRSGTPVVLEVPEPLGTLPAAVEVAAYRIAVEAVTNVDRHAAAATARVRLVAGGGRLTVEVADDGRGCDSGPTSGVGLASMRERAAELGGRCTVTRRTGGGTVVRAELPLVPGEDGGDRGTHPRPAG